MSGTESSRGKKIMVNHVEVVQEKFNFRLEIFIIINSVEKKLNLYENS